MALFTGELGAVWCVYPFKVQIQSLEYHQVWRNKHVWGWHHELWAVPNFGVQLATRLSCCVRWLVSAYRPLPAWSSVIHSWVPRYLKLAARAQDRGTHWGSISCCYIGDGCSSGSNLWPSWRSLYLLSDTLSALSLTHVYLYRCNYWTYLHVPHSTVR